MILADLHRYKRLLLEKQRELSSVQGDAGVRVPAERADLQKLCAELGIPADFDIALITWKPDYDAFYYIFDLERAVIIETPRLGHATYLFSKPINMTGFLALYGSVTKDDIRYNRGNVAERLGFLGRLIHGLNPRGWLKELKLGVGEAVDYAAAELSD